MHTATTGRTRPVIDRRNNRAVRDIAKLRARRAARLAAESAAGRRRMVLTGVCALSTVILGIVIAATSIAWAWLVVPVAALVASLAASRVAAVRSQRASDRELSSSRSCAPTCVVPVVRRRPRRSRALLTPLGVGTRPWPSRVRASRARPTPSLLPRQDPCPPSFSMSRCPRPSRLPTRPHAPGPSPRSPRRPTRRVIVFAAASSMRTRTCGASRGSRRRFPRAPSHRPPRLVPARPKRLSPIRPLPLTWMPSWTRAGPNRAALLSLPRREPPGSRRGSFAVPWRRWGSGVSCSVSSSMRNLRCGSYGAAATV